MLGDGKKLVIIGGGISGISAALAARRTYQGCEITILSQENNEFYNRIGLGGLITHEIENEQLLGFHQNFLRHKRISYLKGVTVSQLAPEAHQVITTDNRVFDYDKLIIASGVRPFVPKINGLAQLAHTLWTLDEASELAEITKEPKHILIIGGGVLAIESALALTNHGHHVTIVEMMPHLMGAQLNLVATTILQNYVQSRGVTVYCNDQIVEIKNQGNEHIFILGSGQQLKADLILCQSGVRPDIAFAREAGVECDRGILVDEHLATNLPDIFACGNCVQISGQPEMLWNSAKKQGEMAGTNAFELRASYKAQPFPLHLKNSDLSIYSCGPWKTAAKVCQEADGNNYKALFFDKTGRLIAVILVGNINDYPLLEKALLAAYQISLKAIDQLSPSAIISAMKTDEDGHQLVWNGTHWVCTQCGYTCEGPIPPAVCPVCHVGRDQFIPA